MCRYKRMMVGRQRSVQVVCMPQDKVIHPPHQTWRAETCPLPLSIHDDEQRKLLRLHTDDEQKDGLHVVILEEARENGGWGVDCGFMSSEGLEKWVQVCWSHPGTVLGSETGGWGLKGTGTQKEKKRKTCSLPSSLKVDWLLNDFWCSPGTDVPPGASLQGWAEQQDWGCSRSGCWTEEDWESVDKLESNKVKTNRL